MLPFQAVYPENSLSYPALILGINDDSTYTVQWVGDAPEGPSGTSAVKPEVLWRFGGDMAGSYSRLAGSSQI